MSDQIVAPRTRDLDELGAQLVPWLESKLPGATGLRVANIDYPRGAGRSHETILFDASWGEGGRERSEGYVVSDSEVDPGVWGVSAPIFARAARSSPGVASITLMAPVTRVPGREAALIDATRRTARDISRRLQND